MSLKQELAIKVTLWSEAAGEFARLRDITKSDAHRGGESAMQHGQAVMWHTLAQQEELIARMALEDLERREGWDVDDEASAADEAVVDPEPAPAPSVEMVADAPVVEEAATVAEPAPAPSVEVAADAPVVEESAAVAEPAPAPSVEVAADAPVVEESAAVAEAPPASSRRR